MSTVNNRLIRIETININSNKMLEIAEDKEIPLETIVASSQCEVVFTASGADIVASINKAAVKNTQDHRKNLYYLHRHHLLNQ